MFATIPTYNCRTVYAQLKPQNQIRTQTNSSHKRSSNLFYRLLFAIFSSMFDQQEIGTIICPLCECILFLKKSRLLVYSIYVNGKSVLRLKCKQKLGKCSIETISKLISLERRVSLCRQSIVQYTMHFMANKPNKLEIRSLLIFSFAVSSSSKWNIFDYGNVCCK